MKDKVVITFHTTAAAIAFEKICRKKNLPGKLSSVPRQVTSDCGIAWCAEISAKEEFERLVKDSELEIDGIHVI